MDKTVEKHLREMTLKRLMLNIENDLQEDGDTSVHLEMTIEEYLNSLPKEEL